MASIPGISRRRSPSTSLSPPPPPGKDAYSNSTSNTTSDGVYFPLRWESTGDQWWYATPVDLAAANGHYDIVRALLTADHNLLIKLSSLRRLRRLETLWDDHPDFLHAPKGRASVARNLLHDCDRTSGDNSLIRAGYGGWLLYTAAAAADLGFVRELLAREPLLVFGEGEFGITDILYAAARSKESAVFWAILHTVLARADNCGVFKEELMNRAAHAAARGGNLEVLRELLVKSGSGDFHVLRCRDSQGCTVLHAAAGRGQVEVVKNLIQSYDMITSRDYQGNTALHLASYRGHLNVVRLLLIAAPPLSFLTNNVGDTFLHTAMLGFRAPGFRRLDLQMIMMKELVFGKLTVYLTAIVNAKNHEGKTALHLAVIGSTTNGDLVQLLMHVRSIDLNVRDNDGRTPLDVLHLSPRSVCSEMLIKQLSSAGGRISKAAANHRSARNTVASRKRMQGLCDSPGTKFKISDSEIFLHTGFNNTDKYHSPEIHHAQEKSGSMNSSSYSNSSRVESRHHETATTADTATSKSLVKKSSSNSAANRLKGLLGLSQRKGRNITEQPKIINGDSRRVPDRSKELDAVKELYSKWADQEEAPTPLRQRFSKASTPNNKRVLAVRTSGSASPSSKKKLSAGLVHGVLEGILQNQSGSKLSAPSPLSSEKLKGALLNYENDHPSCSKISAESSQMLIKSRSRLRKRYLCFGGRHSLAMSNPVSAH